MTKSTKKRPMKWYSYDIDFEAFGGHVKARSAVEAKKKIKEKYQKKSINSMISNLYVTNEGEVDSFPQ